MHKIIKETVSHLLARYWKRFFSYCKEKIVSNYIHNPIFYKNSAKDNESSFLDFKAWDYLFNVEIPSKVDLRNNEVLNQWQTNHCVAFASTWGTNDQAYLLYNNDKSWKYVYRDPKTVVDYIRNYLDKDIDKEWTYIINWPKALLAKGYIEKYVAIETISQLKRSPAMWCPVITGSNTIDWYETWKKWVAVKWNGWGHAININWFDDNVIIEDSKWKRYKWAFQVENTWGERWWLEGYYWVPYELYNLLYNWKYALFINTNKLKEIAENKPNQPFKDVPLDTPYLEWIKWAKEKWIVSWYNDWRLWFEENITVWRFLAILYNYEKKR